VKATKEVLSPTRVKLTVEVPFEELKPDLDSAYKNLSRQVRIPGFRPGRAPAAVLDQRFGRGYVVEQAMQSALPRLYTEAIESESLDVIGQPDVGVHEFSDGQPLVFTAEVDVRPEFELPQYEGLEVTVDEITVDEADVTAQLDTLRDRFATLQPVERPVQDGDFITVDLSATVDGQPVPGADSSGMSYEVGQDNLISGLDDAVRGAEEGSERTFTTELVAGDFAGQEADVTVKIRSVKVKERPELDDDFATTASEFDTLAELEADIRNRLKEAKQQDQGVAARDKLLEKLLESVEVPLPDSAVETEVQARDRSLAQQLAQVGLTREAYLQSEGKTDEEFTAEVRESAAQAVKAQFVLDAIAEKLELNVEQQELTEHLLRRAAQAQMPPQEFANQVMSQNGIGILMTEVLRGKALAHVLDTATITDSSGNPVNLDDIRAGLQDIEMLDEEEDEDEGAAGAAYAEEVAAVDEVSGGAEVGDAGQAAGRGDETVPGAQS
jgi:trigger factor